MTSLRGACRDVVSFVLILGAALLFSSVPTDPAQAAELASGFGYDRVSAHHKSYDGLLVFTSAGLGFCDLTVAATQSRESGEIIAHGAYGDVSFMLGSPMSLRLIGARSSGGSVYDAWRVRAGPEFHAPLNLTVGCYFLHEANSSPGRRNSVGVELTKPLRPSLSVQAGGALGRQESGPVTPQGSLALFWRAHRHVQLHGEIGLGRGVVAVQSAQSGGLGTLQLPILSRLDEPSPDTETSSVGRLEAAGLLGVRFFVP